MASFPQGREREKQNKTEYQNDNLDKSWGNCWSLYLKKKKKKDFG